MSREFGYSTYLATGYMHDRVRQAAEECAEADHPVTVAFGKVLEQMHEMAYGIASYEAGDWGADGMIRRCHNVMPDFTKALDALKTAMGSRTEAIRADVESGGRCPGFTGHVDRECIFCDCPMGGH